MEDQKVQGIDSFVGEYRNERMRVSFDYGIYSNALNEYSSEPEYKKILKKIGGKEAKIVFFLSNHANPQHKYFGAVHFPKVNDTGSVMLKLTLTAEFNEESDKMAAQEIFESVAFPR
jgi:hypothetical protein